MSDFFRASLPQNSALVMGLKLRLFSQGSKSHAKTVFLKPRHLPRLKPFTESTICLVEDQGYVHRRDGNPGNARGN